MLGIAIAVVFFVVALVVALKSPRRGALFCVFLLPWWGLEIDVGVRITAYTLAVAALVPAVLLRRNRSDGFRADSKASDGFLWFAVFTVAWSLSQVYFLPEATVAGGALRGPVMRAILQVFVFGLSICPVFLLPLALRTIPDLMKAGRMYIVSCYCLAALGAAQIGIWYATGKDPLPIGILNQLIGGYNAEFTRSGMFFFEGQSIYRMSSLGGEPKVLGQSLVIAMILLLGSQIYSSRPLTMKGLLAWLFLLLSVFATQSTSAFGLLVIAVAVMTVASLVSSRRRSIRAGLATGATVAFAAGVLAVGILVAGDLRAERLFTWATDVLMERTVGRGSMVEDFDQAILGFLNDQPENYWTGVGLGNIHLYADPYLSATTRRYAGGRVFFAKSGYLKLISESGIIGLCLFLFACLRLLSRLNTLAKRTAWGEGERNWKAQVTVVFVFLFAAFLVRAYVSGHLIACAGIATALCSVLAMRIRQAIPDFGAWPATAGSALHAGHSWRPTSASLTR